MVLFDIVGERARQGEADGAGTSIPLWTPAGLHSEFGWNQFPVNGATLLVTDKAGIR